jgi:hypothetical protein
MHKNILQQQWCQSLNYVPGKKMFWIGGAAVSRCAGVVWSKVDSEPSLQKAIGKSRGADRGLTPSAPLPFKFH